MGNFISQSYFLPAPTITEHNCPNLEGKVFIVTGGYVGIGFELSQILVNAGATVYIAGRSKSKAETAISKIEAAAKSGRLGKVAFLHLDLSDLPTIKPAVESFKEKENRLDVLVNNAGVYKPPVGSLTAQSHDLQVGTNCLGPYLLYTLLAPLLEQTAKSSPDASVRVLWAGSIALDALAPKPGGMQLDPHGCPETENIGSEVIYAQTKVGNVFLARELSRQTPDTRILHVAFNPGNARTELQRNWKGLDARIADLLLLHPPINAAYTELWTAVSPELSLDKSGAYVWPWGRFGKLRPDIDSGARSVAEGGIGLAQKFVTWCNTETAGFVSGSSEAAEM